MNNIEKAVVKKLESIFDNTQHIRNIKVEIEGGLSKHTTMRYDIEEVVFEEEWKEKEDEETVNNNSGI